MKIKILISAWLLLAARTFAATGLHHYTFDSPDVTDSVGTANGTLMDGATVASGRLNLDGSTGYLQFNQQLVPTDGSFSLAFFAQEGSPQNSYTEIISQGFSGGPGFYMGYDPSHDFRIGDNLQSTGLPFPSDGLLHHYAVTADANNTLLYIDGSLSANLDAINMIAGGDDTRLGRQYDPFAEYFQGNVDEVWVFSGTLTASEVATLATAVSYDAVADFSPSQNTDTSTWSYRYQTGTARDGIYTLLPVYGPLNLFSPVDPGFWLLGSEPIPAVGVNQTGSDAHFISGPDFLWPNGAMLIHPGPANLVVVSWLSPINALINIDFSFSDLDPNGSDGVNWFVERNNSSGTLSTGSFDSGGTSGHLGVTRVAVSAGDRINFIVDPAATYSFDSTSLTASITPVPEPPTLSGMRRLDSGAFAFTLTGSPGVYTVLVSQELNQWTEMSRVTNEIGVVQLTDPTATNRARGFYRAMRE